MNIHSNIHKTSDFSILTESKSLSLTFVGGFFALAILAVPGIQAAVSQPKAEQRTLLVESYGKRPLSFEANRGQTDSKVQFLSRGQGYSLFLTPTEAVLALQKIEPRKTDRKQPPLGKPVPAKTSTVSVLRIQLEGANPTATVEGLDQLPGKTHYLRGKDPKAWRTGIPSFAKVKYNGVYPGIDLVYYGNQKQLEYDFVVAPGADPKAIRFHVEGAEQLSLDATGQLVIETQGGQVIQHKPVVYQEIAGVRKEVAGSYALHPDKKGKTADIGFQVAHYDASKPLIIDPVLAYSTYLGGTGGDQGNAIAVDRFGNAYVAGTTSSADFPIVNTDPFGGTSDLYTNAFVTKFDPRGSVIYSTILGGSSPDSPDWANDIAVDAQGNAYVVGFGSNDFPRMHPIQETCNSAFVAKLKPDGKTLAYSTCLGGGAVASAIALDRSGNAYMTGGTTQYFSGDFFPVVNAFQPEHAGGFVDAFVAKLNPMGSALIYSTYLGGASSPLSFTTQGDIGRDIAVDRFGNAYILGSTSSFDFPLLNAAQPDFTFGLSGYDSFLTKLNAAGNALVFSTFLGGGEYQGVTGIAVDRAGNAFIAGDIELNIPTVCATDPCDTTAITKFSPTGKALNSIRLSPWITDIALDRSGNIYLSGQGVTTTDSLIVRPIQPNCDSVNSDAFVVKLSQRGVVNYSTCFGGSANDYGYGIAVDRFNNAYVTGVTESEDLPTVRAVQSSNAGSGDAFVAKIAGR